MVLSLVKDQHGLKEFEAITALPSVDGLLIGPYDPQISVGVSGADFNDPTMSAALDRVNVLCRPHGKAVVTTVGDRQERGYSRNLVERGVQGLVFATDALILLQACKRMVSFAR